MNVALVCDPPHAVLVHKPTWVADGFRAAGHSVRFVHDLAGVRTADAECDLVLFDHKASGMNRAALAELARQRKVAGTLRVPSLLATGSATPTDDTASCSTTGETSHALQRGGYGTPPARGYPVPTTLQRAVWVQWWRDLVAMDSNKRLADQEHVRSFGGVMRGMDIVFVKERSLLDEYHRLGINAHWLDQACPADMPVCEHRERPEWDVLVLGSPGYAQRRADARVLADTGFRVLWAGMAASDPVPPGVEWHPWVHPLKLPELVSRCGVVLGVDWRSDVPGYTSDRTYLACGMGACYVARYTECGSDFPPATHAPQAALAAWIYDSTEQSIESVRLAMSDVSERRRRGAWSRREVMRRHTYAHRAAEIVEMVGKHARSFNRPPTAPADAAH